MAHMSPDLPPALCICDSAPLVSIHKSFPHLVYRLDQFSLFIAAHFLPHVKASLKFSHVLHPVILNQQQF